MDWITNDLELGLRPTLQSSVVACMSRTWCLHSPGNNLTCAYSISPPLNAFVRSYLFKRTNHHHITTEMHAPRPTRPTSFASGLGVSSQALNWQDAGTWNGHDQISTPYNGSLDLELSSWESSSRRTTEGLCLDCVDSYEQCRKHHHLGIGNRKGRPRSRSPGTSKTRVEMDTLPDHRKRPSSCGELERRRRRGMHQQQISWSA